MGGRRMVRRRSRSTQQSWHHDCGTLLTEAAWIDLSKLALKIARHACYEPEEAEDIAQEALLRLALDLDSGSGRLSSIQSPAAWLRTVVRNLALHRRRQRDRTRSAEVDYVRERADLSRPGEERTVLAHELLLRLSLLDKQLLTLAAIGLKHREIGALFGWSTSSVGIRLARARRRAEEIAEAGDADPDAKPSGSQ